MVKWEGIGEKRLGGEVGKYWRKKTRRDWTPSIWGETGNRKTMTKVECLQFSDTMVP